MSFLALEIERPNITFKQARQVASCAFGKKGEMVIDLWEAYNHHYFESALKPVPILFVPTSPYGHWTGLTVGTKKKKSALIYLKTGELWTTTKCVLLHEMIHQHLIETNRNTGHNSQDWCDEIMRISKDYFGAEFWAGRYTVGKKRTKEGDRISVRINKSGPKGEKSISMAKICSWPSSIKLIPPDIKEMKS